MNRELRTMTPFTRSSTDIDEHEELGKRFKSIFRKMRNISATQLSELRRPSSPTQDVEPIALGQRVVFRAQGQVPVQRLVELHKLMKSKSILASEALNFYTNGEPTSIPYSGLHCAVRHVFEE